MPVSASSILLDHDRAAFGKQSYCNLAENPFSKYREVRIQQVGSKALMRRELCLLGDVLIRLKERSVGHLDL